MKAKISRWKKWSITLLLVVAGFFLCRILYTLLDDIFNGAVVDWFEENYIIHEWIDKEGMEWDGYYKRTIDWPRLKRLLFWTFAVCTITWILVARGIFLAFSARQKEAVIHAAGQMIRDYMNQNREAAEIFPVDYAEISMQITEIKATMQQHEQTLRTEAARKNDLITYLAHDLKTPLTSVIGYLSLLEEVPDMPSKQKAKYVHITLDKALRLERLINEFFEITRYNLQQIILEKEQVNLAFLLVQLVDEFYPILSAHGNTVLLETETVSPGTEEPARETEETSVSCKEKAEPSGNTEDREDSSVRKQQDGRTVLHRESAGMGQETGDGEQKDSLLIYGDGEKLARVFNNILKNAVAYSYAGTQIRIWCERTEDSVNIYFQNQGKTIPAHKLDAIFEKFFRLEDARSSNTGGAGLGLAIAREIVNMHGGAITATSQDEVTRFQVTLPA